MPTNPEPPKTARTPKTARLDTRRPNYQPASCQDIPPLPAPTDNKREAIAHCLNHGVPVALVARDLSTTPAYVYKVGHLSDCPFNPRVGPQELRDLFIALGVHSSFRQAVQITGNAASNCQKIVELRSTNTPLVPATLKNTGPKPRPPRGYTIPKTPTRPTSKATPPSQSSRSPSRSPSS